MTPTEIRTEGKQIPKSEFDQLCKEKKIRDAQEESFGDGYGEPYNPNRLIFGHLNGELVWTESLDKS